MCQWSERGKQLGGAAHSKRDAVLHSALIDPMPAISYGIRGPAFILCSHKQWLCSMAKVTLVISNPTAGMTARPSDRYPGNHSDTLERQPLPNHSVNCASEVAKRRSSGVPRIAIGMLHGPPIEKVLVPFIRNPKKSLSREHQHRFYWRVARESFRYESSPISRDRYRNKSLL